MNGYQQSIASPIPVPVRTIGETFSAAGIMQLIIAGPGSSDRIRQAFDYFIFGPESICRNAVCLRENFEIGMKGKVYGNVAPLAVKFLELPHHSKALVVQNDYLDAESLLHHGAQFLHVHLEAAVAGHQDHFHARDAQGCADGGRQAESHASESARTTPGCEVW